MIVLGEEEGLVCKVTVDGRLVAHDLKLVLDNHQFIRSWSRKKVKVEIRSLGNARDLQLECGRVLHKCVK